MLADCPEVALAAAVHALALPVFYADHDRSGLAIHAASPFLRAEGIDHCLASKRFWPSGMRHGRRSCRATRPALWDWLRTQDAATLTGLLAYCVACTVKPERGTAADQLAAAVALDMAQWWQPTVAGYFGRVPKTLILEAVREGQGPEAADNLAALKKGEMAERAAERLTGTGWLPVLLRAA